MNNELVEEVAKALFNAMCVVSGRSIMWTEDSHSWPPQRDREHARLGARTAIATIADYHERKRMQSGHS